MLDCFRPSKGVDPQVFASAIIGILLRYPATVVEEVTSPVVGLASRQEFMPSPYDVRQACEALMRPLRERNHKQRQIQTQLGERQAAEAQQGRGPPRQTMAEIEDEMHARGLDMPGWEARQQREVDLKLRTELSARYGRAYGDIPEAADALTGPVAGDHT